MAFKYTLDGRTLSIAKPETKNYNKMLLNIIKLGDYDP